MTFIWDWFWQSAPWWLQLTLAAIPVCLLIWLAGTVFGWQRVRPLIIPILGALAALGLYNKARLEGWKANEDRRNREADEQVQRAREVRRKTQDALRQDPTKVFDKDKFRRD